MVDSREHGWHQCRCAARVCALSPRLSCAFLENWNVRMARESGNTRLDLHDG